MTWLERHPWTAFFFFCAIMWACGWAARGDALIGFLSVSPMMVLLLAVMHE